MASTIGSCSITRLTLVPMISSEVAAAANDSAMNGSWVRRYFSSSGPPSRATIPAETGMCVCSVRNSDVEAALLGRAGQHVGTDAVADEERREPDLHAATRCSMPSRAALTSRWRRPNASLKRWPMRLRKHAIALGGALGRHRRHLDLRQPAGHDPAERVEVVVDVDREAVRGDAVGDVHADRGDLALADPHADVLVAEPGRRLHARVAERGDDRALHREDVLRHARDAHDRVADQLPGAVVGELAAARRAHDVDPALAVERLAERQVALVRAAPDRVDRRVLEQQHQLRQLTGDDPLAQALLQGRRLAVFDPSEVADPEFHAS